VLRTFPELVGRSVKNLEEIGLAVRSACKGYIGTNGHFYIYRLEKCVKMQKRFKTSCSLLSGNCCIYFFKILYLKF